MGELESIGGSEQGAGKVGGRGEGGVFSPFSYSPLPLLIINCFSLTAHQAHSAFEGQRPKPSKPPSFPYGMG